MKFNDQLITDAKNTVKTTLELADYYAKKTDLVVKMKSFGEVYDAKEIEADIKLTVEKMNSEEPPSRLAKILENVVADFGNKWYDENVRFVQLSPFDDRNARGDVVMEIKNGDKIIRVLVDLTTGENPEYTNDKMYNNEKDMREGKLASVKYFNSKMENIKGELKNLPRVVAGVGKTTMSEFLELMAAGVPVENKKDISLMLLEEIADQLIWLQSLAQKGQAGSRTENVFKDSIQAIQDLLEKNKSLLTNEYREKALSDNVYNRLKLK
jgi:hypothetical protein